MTDDALRYPEAEIVPQSRLCELLILEEAINRSGFDVSPCQHCGMPVVCLPDGMPCCEECAGEADR